MNIDKKEIKIVVNNFCFLKILSKEDVSNNYIEWMNNYEITKYTEQKNLKHDKKSIQDFVDLKFNSKTDYLFGIYYSNTHIGNIKIGNINWFHKRADISYIIGIKDYWGKGIATSSILKIVEFSFKNLDLKKLNAAYYENNIGSGKALNKSGFKIEGKKINDNLFEGERINTIIVGLINKKINNT